MAQDKRWQLVLDFTILACVCFPLLALVGWGRPFHRGFFERDDSIRLPYKQQTITEATLACVGFILNIAVILIIEYLQKRKDKNPNQYLFRFVIPGWVWRSYSAIRTFTFGAACQQLAANLTKYVIGRLRPHFIDVCQPIYNASSPANALGYIQDYTCANQSDGRLKDASLSFFSAHSSFAMYAAVFCIIYIQEKGRWRGSKLLRHAFQFLVLLGAWYTGLTRIVENFHHWSDVTVGFINGAIFAIMVVVYVLKPSKRLSMSWQDSVPESMLPPPVPAR